MARSAYARARLLERAGAEPGDEPARISYRMSARMSADAAESLRDRSLIPPSCMRDGGGSVRRPVHG